jgi:hypothetical protein
MDAEKKCQRQERRGNTSSRFRGSSVATMTGYKMHARANALKK